MASQRTYCGNGGGASDGVWPNSCNANLYQTGEAGIGWHSDNEAIFGPTSQESLIISLSLGQSRRFQIRKKKEQLAWETWLHNGDLLTMEGLFQNHYEHQVPKEIGVNEAGVNVTWRWILKGTSFDQSTRRQRFGTELRTGLMFLDGKKKMTSILRSHQWNNYIQT